MTHIQLDNHGTLCVLTGMTEQGREWLDEHLDPDGMKWAGGHVVEPRYVGDILDGASEAGLWA